MTRQAATGPYAPALARMPGVKLVGYESTSPVAATGYTDIYTCPTGRRAVWCSLGFYNDGSSTADTLRPAVKISGTYVDLYTSTTSVANTFTTCTDDAATSQRGIGYIMEAGEIASVNRTAGTANLTYYAAFIEFDASSGAFLKTVKKNSSWVNGDNTVYTVPAGYYALPVQMRADFGLPIAGTSTLRPCGQYLNRSGGTVNVSIYAVPSGQSSATKYRLHTAAVADTGPGTTTRIVGASCLLLAAGDKLVVNVDSTADTQVAMLNVLEIPISAGTAAGSPLLLPTTHARQCAPVMASVFANNSGTTTLYTCPANKRALWVGFGIYCDGTQTAESCRVQVVIGGTTYGLFTTTGQAPQSNTLIEFNIGYVLEAAEVANVVHTGGSVLLTYYALFYEFDAASCALKTVKMNTGFGAGNNTVYTVPAGNTFRPIPVGGTVSRMGDDSTAPQVNYSNISGATRTVAAHHVPSGQSVGTQYLVKASATHANGTYGTQYTVPGLAMAAGDFLNVNLDAGAANQIVWCTGLELLS